MAPLTTPGNPDAACAEGSLSPMAAAMSAVVSDKKVRNFGLTGLTVFIVFFENEDLQTSRARWRDLNTLRFFCISEAVSISKLFG